MRDSKRHSHRALQGLLTGALVLCAAAGAAAQQASATYRGSTRDPFVKYRPALKRRVEKKVLAPIQPPPIQARIDQYKAQKLAAMNLQQPAPKPTTALTLGEIQVIGIFRTPRGYAAMVEATPIQLSYVVYPGEAFYDGMLVAIEETRLVFRRQTRWTDGHVEVAVDTKQLRQPNAYVDSLTAQKVAPAVEGSAAPASAGGKSEVTALVEALKALAAGSQSQHPQGNPEAQGGQGGGKP
jgi:hypothetical protein